MNDPRSPFGSPPPYAGRPSTMDAQPTVQTTAFLTHAFTWMFAGLLVTAIVSTLVVSNQTLLEVAYRSWIVLAFAQLGIALFIQAALPRIGATVALGLFFVYAATLGLTVGLIVSAYTGQSVFVAFVSASAMFGGAALYGRLTRRSLAGIGPTLIIGVWGLLVAMIVNIFLGSSPLGFAIAIVGVILFTALTAYDVQRISVGGYVNMFGSVEKAAVFGALHLYIEFVNIFLFLLRLTGSRR